MLTRIRLGGGARGWLALAAAAPASAVTHKQATSRALTALGSTKAGGPIVVFGLPKPLRAGSRVTQAGSRQAVVTAGRRAFFFYEDAGPSQPYPHPGRVALVSVRDGKVTLSRTFTRAPRVNGRAPAFLRSRAAYDSARYRVLARSGSTATAGGSAPSDGTVVSALREDEPWVPFEKNSPPTAFGQELFVKQGVPKRVTLSATDVDEDPLTFHVLERPRFGKLTGQPPDLVYTPLRDYLGPDEFVFVARDDDKDSEPTRISLQVVPRGEAPTISTSPGCTGYTEQGQAVAIDRELSVFDPDDKELDRATIRIAESFQAGDELVFHDKDGIKSTYNADTGVLSLTGTAPVEAYVSALRSIEYRNLTDATPTQSKYISFTVNDAGLDSATVIKQLCLIITELDNDPPVGETSEAGLLYIENDGPVPVDGGFVVGDPDSTHLSRATIAFVPHVSQPVDENGDPVGPPVVTHSFVPAEDELTFVDQNGITGVYDDVNGVMRLRGVATLAHYEAAIRSVMYENTSEDPSEATRRVEFTLLDDGRASSVPVRRDAFISAINDPPVLRPSKGWTFYTGKPTLIDPELLAIDVDDELRAAWVRITDGFVYGDVLEYAEQFGISGNYDPESGVLELKGLASAADYEAALRSVAYASYRDKPSGTRTVEFVTYDGDAESAAATKVVATDGRPIVRVTEKPLVYTVGDGWVPVDEEVTVTDPDSEYLVGATVAIERGFVDAEDELLFEEQNGIVGEYDDGTGVLTLRGEALVADYEAALRSVLYEHWSKEGGGVRTLSFQVDDGGESSDPVYRDIEITPLW